MHSSEEIRKIFTDFWTNEPRNCKVIPNVSLVPNINSTLLYVNSGMFPVTPYLSGEPHPLGKRLCNIQRCLRTNYDEMIEVGDNRHTLMFEMMGDWSLGDFFKKEQIPWILELHVEKYGLDPSRLYISVFAGDDDAPRDDEAIKLWKQAFRKYGIEAEFSEDISNIPQNLEEGKTHKYRIFPYVKKKNWWQRAEAPGELGGPSSEIFYDLGEVIVIQDQYHINDDSGRFVEIGNNVFMQYKLDENMKWQPLAQKNIDFGGGLERVVMVVQNKKDIFETDIYAPILNKISEISGVEYKTQGKENKHTPAFRVIADHGRAATFILADGVYPSNKDQGYILRRFIRRLVRFGIKLGIETNFTKDISISVIERLEDVYPHLKENEAMILDEIEKEEIKFRRTLDKGLKELNKVKELGEPIDGAKAFFIYETYGFPLEMTLDELGVGNSSEAKEITEQFKEIEKKHREESRAGAEKKFKGGLADTSEQTTKLHTAHHLLLKALQIVLGEDVKQRGSNITAERLRIDFNYPEKLTDEQIKRVEEIVNEKISEGLDVVRMEMPLLEAEKIGAQMEFGQKYPDVVSVYFMTSDLTPSPSPLQGEGGRRPGEVLPQTWFSAEFCGGPHVKKTSELGTFKIVKQENIGGGLRRIKAVLV